jgi:hypothetical protein
MITNKLFHPKLTQKFMSNKFVFFFIGLLLIGFTGCKTSDSTTVNPKTNTENLVAVTWQVQTASSSGGLLVLYEKDKANNGYDLSKVRLSFKSNGTVSGIDNNGNTSSNGTWKFTNSEKMIEISGINIGGISFGVLTIVKLGAQNFDFTGKASIPKLNIAETEASIKMIPAQ